tara:strand:- start:326 stop:700 length:375 start_codon:yes stop_codon:yes gene_type:complete
MKKSSNKNFGLTFFVIFLIISFYPILVGNKINFWFLFISLMFLVVSFFNPKILNPLNIIWTKFGILLGKIFSPLIMSLVYFLVMTPISFYLKLINKDVLNLKINHSNTYWEKKKDENTSMKNQF